MNRRALVVLAADPGPTRWGWAILVILFTQEGTLIRWIAGDHEVWSTALCLRLLFRALDEARRYDADVLVTSEIVTGKVFDGRSDANVLDTSRECGRATPVAEAVSLLHGQGRLAAPAPFPLLVTAEYTTAQWQAVLTGHAKGVTQEVHDLCARALVTGLPVLPKSRGGIKYAEHVHDACCIAIAAGFLARGQMRVPIAGPTQLRIHALVKLEDERRRKKAQENKTKRALGLLEPRQDLRRRPRSGAELKRRSVSVQIATARRA